MGNIAVGIAATRNKVGYSHGDPEVPKGLQESHALFVIDSAYTLTRFITTRLNERFS